MRKLELLDNICNLALFNKFEKEIFTKIKYDISLKGIISINE